LDQIDKLNVNVEDTDIDRVIDQLRKQYTTWNLVDRGAQKDDRAVIDYYAIFEGKSDIENKIQNFPLILGSGVMLPGFEDGLMGAKAGESRTLNLKFPEDFSVKERAGKPVDFVVEVKQVFEADMPTLDGDFVKKLGVASGEMDEFKKQIRQSLEHERDRLLKDKLKEQVFQKLLDQNPIQVPKSLIERESKTIHDEVYQHQQHDHHSHSEEEMSKFNEVAAKRVALSLLMNEYSKQTNLKVDEDRVKQRIQEIASVYETPAEVIAYLSSKEQRPGIESQVMEDQILDKMLEGVPTKEKTMSYAELKGIRI
jgi:trigger factor